VAPPLRWLLCVVLLDRSFCCDAEVVGFALRASLRGGRGVLRHMKRTVGVKRVRVCEGARGSARVSVGVWCVCACVGLLAVALSTR